MRERVVTTHIHDNHGEKDEHLLPYEGNIDWEAASLRSRTLPQPVALVLELKEQPGGEPALDQIRATFDRLEKQFEKGGTP